MSAPGTPARATRRAWGWHLLADPWAVRVVASADLSAGDLVVDFGAGRGALVGPLLSIGTRVIAVELHPGRAQALRDRWPAQVAERQLSVVQRDALTFRLPIRPFRVVANPPYTIVSPLLRHLLAPGSRLQSASLVVPKAVAARWTAGQAAGAGRWQRTFRLEVAMAVPRRAFRPPPRLDSVVLVVRRR